MVETQNVDLGGLICYSVHVVFLSYNTITDVLKDAAAEMRRSLEAQGTDTDPHDPQDVRRL